MRLHVKTYAPPYLKAGEHVARWGEHVARWGRAHPRTELIAICDLRAVRVGAPGVREGGEGGVSAHRRRARHRDEEPARLATAFRRRDPALNLPIDLSFARSQHDTTR